MLSELLTVRYAVSFWEILRNNRGVTSGVDLWGDMATWVGSIGTVGALIWAVFIYSGSVKDKKIAQARLLSVVGPPVQVQVMPGDMCKQNPSIFIGVNAQPKPPSYGSGGGMILLEEAVSVFFRLTSTSDETFTITSVEIMREDGSALQIEFGWSDIEPHGKLEISYYFPPETLGATKCYRVRFRDAAGRHWERVNGEPVRKYKP